MGEGIRRRLLQDRFEGPHHEAMLNVMVAAAHLRERLDRICGEHGLTRGQYNALRILKGKPVGYPRFEISRRMVERAPDVTRLIDRLAAEGLVERERSGDDARLSVTRITRQGISLLERMKPAIDELSADLESRLGAAEARELSRLCEAIYDATD